MVFDAMDAICAQQGVFGAFAKNELADIIARGRSFSSDDINVSVETHIKRLLREGYVIKIGSLKASGMGRPQALYSWSHDQEMPFSPNYLEEER